MNRTRYQREISAPPEIVFDLYRSIDFHIEAAQGIRARAVGGQTTGFAEEGTSTVYSAAFFGCRFRLMMEATDFRSPYEFRDTMSKGLFSHFSHHYLLTPTSTGCLLEDTFSFASPFGFLGKLIEPLLMSPSLKTAQNARLDAIKKRAESLHP